MTSYIFPGQGAQVRGMGKQLFSKYHNYLEEADDILGYSLEKLCCETPDEQLNNTQYAQPALYVVGALNYLNQLDKCNEKPKFVAGHSLGEYIALFAASVFDFRTGLHLVKKRGELMSQMKGGAVAIISGLRLEKIEEILYKNSLSAIEVSCHNAPMQASIAGPENLLLNLGSLFKSAGASFYTKLNVNAAFHSSHMNKVKEQFSEFLNDFCFQEPTIPVVANVTALPYRKSEAKINLLNQISSRVKWSESICYMINNGEEDFIEITPGTKTFFMQLMPEIRTEAMLIRDQVN